jgi:hypothetical protein
MCLQISETSVSKELKDYKSLLLSSGQDAQLRTVTSRRIGALGSSLTESDAALGFNSVSVPAWCPAGMPLLAITCSTNEPLHRILQWIRYHQLIGFSLFYFFVEGKASEPEVVDALRQLVGVKVWVFHVQCSIMQLREPHVTLIAPGLSHVRYRMSANCVRQVCHSGSFWLCAQ